MKKRRNEIMALAALSIILTAAYFYFRIPANSYAGGYAPDGSFCHYGYNYDTHACCSDDDYSCQIRDEAPPGTTVYCNDGTYSQLKTANLTCSDHGGINTESKFNYTFR
ncbi:hypothetical protein BH11PAT2_BH11PAT2_04880 [soil metagenome]